MAPSGRAPLCAGCRSTERHRIGRAVADKIRTEGKLASYSLLNWGEPGSVAKGWFAKAEVTSADDLDAGLAERADQSLDFIVASNVLHRVPDHRRMLEQMVRVLSADGLILLYYANPMLRERTEDWGHPDPARGSAYRMIGRDFESEYATVVPQAIVFRVSEEDPATGAEDIVYILTKSASWMRRLAQLPLNTRILD